MSIANLKKLATAFNVPHAESTTAGHECLHCVCEAARKEAEALEKAVTTLVEQRVRNRLHETVPGPWSEACSTLEVIYLETKP